MIFEAEKGILHFRCFDEKDCPLVAEYNHGFKFLIEVHLPPKIDHQSLFITYLYFSQPTWLNYDTSVIPKSSINQVGTGDYH